MKMHRHILRRSATEEDSKHKLRLLAAFSLIGLIWLILTAIRWGSGIPRLHAAATLETQPVVIRPGDTLWRLAIDHGPPGADPRRTVDTIRRINRLSDTDLYPGMILHVPTRANQLL
ncbi:MAG: LysM peptidoglycan-binding domain-containing protein [Firmicutes bacterium]|jgi:hypothetical protein|nr:LysM peptidoglycan-binding domain-containing protein [Bacillota bacterium]